MENHTIQVITQYLRTHPHISELFTFLIAFLESLPLIGTIIPGSITMTAIGVLVGMGDLPALLTLCVASIGAFSGDSIGYLIGYFYNDRLRNIWPFKKHPKWLSMGERFFKKHGGKSIVLGRFIGPARSTVPLVAGLLKMSWVRFCVASFPSAILWALMYTTPGIVLGALSREVPKGETTRFFLYGIGTLIVLWLTFWLIQHFFIQLARGINKITDRCWHYFTRHHAGRFFIRLITNRQKPTDHHQLTLSLAALISGSLFLILLFKIRHFGAFHNLNYPLFSLLQSIRTPFWNKLFVIVTIMGTPKTIAIISVLATAGFMLKKQWRTATHFFAGFILAAGSVVVFKALSHSVRPQGFEFVAHSSSFPSGHTTLSFVVFGLLAFFIGQAITKKFRWIPYTVTSLFIVAVAFSRLYLGAHWFTDIIGSLLLGFAVILCCIVAYRRMPITHSAIKLNTLSIATLIVISIFLPWIIMITHTFSANMQRYTRIWPKQQITINRWWQSPLHYTPLYRDNRIGKPFQPFNVQYQGALNTLSARLKKAGWQIMSNHRKLKSSLQRFASYKAQYHIPVFPWLYHDKPPVLFMIKSIPLHNRIIELRFWESNIHLQPGKNPLWLGAINIRIPPKILLSLKEEATISLAGKGGLNTLYQDTADFQRKMIHVSHYQKISNLNTDKLDWNGEILLLR